MSTPVFITGMPNGGSQLLAALIDSLPDAVCLNQLPEQWEFAKRPMNAPSYAKWLVGDALWQRQQLLEKRPVLDFRNEDGSPWLERYDLTDQSPQRVRCHFKEDSTLCLHNTSIYSAVLPALSMLPTRLFATIRHPLVQCRLWRAKPQMLPVPGKPPGIMRFWGKPVEIREGDAPEAFKLVQIYEAFLGRYHELEKRITILRYEDLLEKPVIVSDAFDADVLPKQADFLSVLPVEPTQPKDEFEEEVMRHLKRHAVFAKLHYRF